MSYHNGKFYWYRPNGDGTAQVIEDSPALTSFIDSDPQGWFHTAEGAILHAGVQATAFTRRTDKVYDAAHWLATGELVPAGEVTTTTITAEAKS